MAPTKKTETKAAAEEMTAKTAIGGNVPAGKTEYEKKEVPVKAAASKKAAGKAAVSKTKAAGKGPASKTGGAKAAIKTKVYVQYHGKEVSVEMLTEEVKKVYTAAGHKASEIKTVALYVKPEEDVAYFVVNGEGSEECRIYL